MEIHGWLYSLQKVYYSGGARQRMMKFHASGSMFLKSEDNEIAGIGTLQFFVFLFRQGGKRSSDYEHYTQ